MPVYNYPGLNSTDTSRILRRVLPLIAIASAAPLIMFYALMPQLFPAIGNRRSDYPLLPHQNDRQHRIALVKKEEAQTQWPYVFISRFGSA